MRPALLFATLAALAGCADYPEVIAAQDVPTAAGDPPPLRPLYDVLAEAGTATITPETTAQVEARAAALRARARAMAADDKAATAP